MKHKILSLIKDVDPNQYPRHGLASPSFGLLRGPVSYHSPVPQLPNPSRARNSSPFPPCPTHGRRHTSTLTFVARPSPGGCCARQAAPSAIRPALPRHGQGQLPSSLHSRTAGAPHPAPSSSPSRWRPPWPAMPRSAAGVQLRLRATAPQPPLQPVAPPSLPNVGRTATAGSPIRPPPRCTECPILLKRWACDWVSREQRRRLRNWLLRSTVEARGGIQQLRRYNL